MTVFRCSVVLVLGMMCRAASRAEAHPISVTWADVTVAKTKVSAELKVLAEDFLFFQRPKLNDEDYVEPEELRKAIEKHSDFLLKNFVVLGARDQRLEGKIVSVEPFEMPPEGIHMGDLMAHSVLYRIAYELSSPPEFLTIYQQFGSQELTWPALMQLKVAQEGFPAQGPLELESDRPHTIRFDWDRAPLSPAASAEERQKREEEERRKTLGIGSYGSIYSFIYINDYEVRHEILIPLLTMENWFPVERKGPAFLEIEEQDAARDEIEEFFSQGNPVEIDGVEVKPVLKRVDYYGLDFRDFAQQAARRRLSVATARAGVILSYSTKGAPTHVKMTCDMLDWQVRAVRSIVFAYDDTSKAVFSRYEPTFEWTSPGRPPLPGITRLAPPPKPPKRSLPAASLICLVLLVGTLIGMKRKGVSRKSYVLALLLLGVCAALAWPYARVEMADPFAPRPTISEAEALAVFSTLHKNVYRAFDYHSESDVYDALAKSVSGELLSKLYLQIRKGLEMQEQGGAISRVREVKIVEGHKEPPQQGDPADSQGFALRCTWTVNGTVEHWGHIHSRTNQYGALFTVEPNEDAWKITDLQVLSEERVQFETSVRRLK